MKYSVSGWIGHSGKPMAVSTVINTTRTEIKGYKMIAQAFARSVGLKTNTKTCRHSYCIA